VREVIDVVNRTGSNEPPQRLLDLFAADVKIDMSQRKFNPDIYIGHDGLRRFQRERDEVWEAFWVTPERFIDAGDKVLVLESLRARGKGSGVETTKAKSASVWTLRDGQVVHMAPYWDRDLAFKAAGLAG
jgi:ketosteroid isomerase-like protein